MKPHSATAARLDMLHLYVCLFDILLMCSTLELLLSYETFSASTAQQQLHSFRKAEALRCLVAGHTRGTGAGLPERVRFAPKINSPKLERNATCWCRRAASWTGGTGAGLRGPTYPASLLEQRSTSGNLAEDAPGRGPGVVAVSDELLPSEVNI